MQTGEILQLLENKINDIYENELMVDLEHKSLTSRYLDATRKASIRHIQNFNFLNTWSDLLMCSRQIMYFTAQMHLYKDFVNNPTENPIYMGNTTVYRNSESKLSLRYDIFSDSAFQSLYNYWDRIGDIIAYFLKGYQNFSFQERSIYFGKIIDVVPENLKDNDGYRWLKKFKDEDYTFFNEKRISIVHKETLNTQFKNKYLESPSNFSNINNLYTEKMNRTEYLKGQLNKSIEGCEQMILFFEHINSIIYADIDYPPHSSKFTLKTK